MTAPPCPLCDLWDHWLSLRGEDAHRAQEAASHNTVLTTASHRADASLDHIEAARRRHVQKAHPHADGDAA